MIEGENSGHKWQNSTNVYPAAQSSGVDSLKELNPYPEERQRNLSLLFLKF